MTTASARSIPTPMLYYTVAVSGAAVLALEIIGTRLLGPFYGVSLYLWSALITITLGALSVGYLVGGATADRSPGPRPMYYFIAAAGIWTLTIPWLKYPVIGMLEPVGLRAGVLLSATVLFFLPLMALGTVTPYAIRLSATALDSIGRTSGRLFAVSTIASVAAALLTGFYLIPNIGVFLLTTSVGVLLILTSAAGLKVAGGMKAPVTLLLTLGVAFFSPREKARPESGLIEIRQSPYGEIRVYDNQMGRHLLIDGMIHTRLDTASRTSTLFYTSVMEIPMLYFNRANHAAPRAALIGVGAGALIGAYEQSGWSVDAVEIDEEVIDVAARYFHFSHERLHLTDGRRFLRDAEDPYDVILVDAYGSSSIPFHLVTVEAFREAKGALKEGGIVAINVISVGWHDPMVTLISATLDEVFHEVLALPMAEPPDRLGNLILLASDSDLRRIEGPPRDVFSSAEWRYGPMYAAVHAWDNAFVPETEGVQVITDDLNPIDIRSEAVKAVAREDLRKYFPEGAVYW